MAQDIGRDRMRKQMVTLAYVSKRLLEGASTLCYFCGGHVLGFQK